MGILDRASKNTKSKSESKELTKAELEFILLKLRSATYRGDEFEMFYNTWVKLVNQIEERVGLSSPSSIYIHKVIIGLKGKWAPHDWCNLP